MTRVRAQAVLLDMDGTLVDSSAAVAVRRTCRDLVAVRTGLDEALLLAANSEVFRQYFNDIEDAWTLGRIDGASVSREAWRRTLERCGCDDGDLARWAQERMRLHSASTIQLFPDGQLLLEQLTGRVKLALITNGASDTQRQALEATGIEKLFDVIFISGEHGVAKPEGAVFRSVLDDLEVSASEAWHVGDSLGSDVSGAVAAGLTAVWLNRAGNSAAATTPAPHHQISSLQELLPLLGF